MRKWIVLVLVVVGLASFASAENAKFSTPLALVSEGGQAVIEMTATAQQVVPASAVRRHLVTTNSFRCGLDEEGITTPGASMSVLRGPLVLPYLTIEEGKAKVLYSAWFGVPGGTTFTGYAIHSDGTREYLGHYTVPAELADRGWSGCMWGFCSDDSCIIPEDVVGYRLEFTGAFATYSVNATVPDPARTPALVDVYPDGRLFLRVWTCPAPVVSLDGRVHTVVNGWITPQATFTGPDVPVAVCSGYPDSECLTQVVDIPTPTPSQ